MDRRTALSNLVGLRGPVADVVAAVRALPWDSAQELATVGPAEVAHVLSRYLAGTLSAADVESWAEALEGRDDIRFAPPEVVDIVFELANPTLAGALTPEQAERLLRRARPLG